MRKTAPLRARLLESVARDEVTAELYARGADAEAVRMIVDRGLGRAMLVGPLPMAEAQNLRKAAAEAGAMAVLSRPAGRQDPERAEVVVMAPAAKLLKLAEGVGGEAGARMQAALEAWGQPQVRVLRARDREITLGERTVIMGIVNVTPDSFSGDGLGAAPTAAAAQGQAMVAAGAAILDVGGESTRPGAETVSLEEELSRVVPVVEALGSARALLSVDTYKAAVARAALDKGAHIVNDISGLRFDPDMAKVVADSGAAVVLMHIQGTPRDMQQNPKYDDVIGEISDYLAESIALAEEAGVARDRIIVDPGFGFGKNLEHNLELIRRLGEFRVLGCPILLGVSRKRTLGALLDDVPADQRLEGTAAGVALAIAAGVDIVRMHDVKEMAKVARVADAVVRVEHAPPVGSEHKWSHQRKKMLVSNSRGLKVGRRVEVPRPRSSGDRNLVTCATEERASAQSHDMAKAMSIRS